MRGCAVAYSYLACFPLNHNYEHDPSQPAALTARVTGVLIFVLIVTPLLCYWSLTAQRGLIYTLLPQPGT
jgi:hypothetical protein